MYRPSPKILNRYADVLVNFALGQGKGIRKGEVVLVVIPEMAKPLLVELRKTILQAGGHVLLQYLPDDEERYACSRDFYTLATDTQLHFFPRHYYRGLVDQTDHILFILAQADKHALEGMSPKKLMVHRASFEPYLDWRMEKEQQGKLSWTIGLYGTPAMAQEAGMTSKAYWQQIIGACFLDQPDPISMWRKTTRQIATFAKRLTTLAIDSIHIVGADVDLHLKIGEGRQWLAGRGVNIPSFEIFTSPDWRGTQGTIHFNQPLYYSGSLIKGVTLHFHQGKVINATATKNQPLLQEMIAIKGADKVGEISLTDGRFSSITHFMAETLYDENRGGPFGNTHIALGKSYHDTYRGKIMQMKQTDWQRLGFNDSVIHTDIVSTTDRKVSAILANGEKLVIYEKGRFTI